MATEALKMPESKTPDKPKLNLFQKMADAVREIDNVEKRGKNDFQKYNYVKAADVAWMVRKALSERNIYLVSDVVEIRNYEIPAKEGHMQAVDLRIEFSFFDGDDPATPPIVLHSWGTGTDKGDKAVYKAMTGALKYGLRHAFLIPDESDPEADSTVDAATAAQAVGKRKVAELKAKMAESQAAPTTLFYVWPDKHNGNYAEFINIREYAAGLDQVAAEGLRKVVAPFLSKNFAKGGATYIPRENMQALLEKLVGDCGVDVKELKAPREPGQEG